MRTALIVTVSLAASAAVLTAGASAVALGAPPADAPGEAIEAAPAIVGDWSPTTFDADASHQQAIVVQIPSAIGIEDAGSDQGVSDSGSAAPDDSTPPTPPAPATAPSTSPNPGSGNSGNGNGNSGNGNGNENSGNGNSGNGNSGNGNSGNGNSGDKKYKSDD